MRKSLLLFLFLLVMAVPVSARSIEVERWDVVIRNIDVPRNTYEVEETLLINVSGTYFYGTRDIDIQEIDSVTLNRVVYNGEALALDCAGERGTVCAESSTLEYNIRYEFPEALTDDTATVTLTYTVTGGIEVTDSEDIISWWVIPRDRSFEIGEGSLRVELPNEYPLKSWIFNSRSGNYSGNIEETLNDDEALYTFESMQRYQNLYYTLTLEHHPDGIRADWQDHPKYVEPTRNSSASRSDNDLEITWEFLLFGGIVLWGIGNFIYRAVNGLPLFPANSDDDGGTWSSSGGNSFSSHSGGSSSYSSYDDHDSWDDDGGGADFD